MASNEEENSLNYQTRIESTKRYKEKHKLNEIEEGMKVDVKDTEGIWCEATVKTILKLEKNKLILVHYDRWDEFFDELISWDSPRIAPMGTYTARSILKYKLMLPEGNRQGEVIE